MTTTLPLTATDEIAAAEGLAGRLMEAAVGAAELYTIALGLDLGLYETLAARGPLTAPELAEARGLDRRYVQEWCDQQALAGLLTVTGDDPRRFAAAPGVAATLLDPVSPAYVAPVAWVQEAISRVMPQLADGFRTGAGVPFADYGPRLVEVQGAFNRPAFANSLVPEWVPAIPGLVDRLTDPTRPATVADIGCGVGWAAIELAKSFPLVTIHGYDADETSIGIARRNAVDAGVDDRVRFEVVEAGARPDDRFDVAFFFECVHDMAHPTDVLRRVRETLADDGFVVVMDERADEQLTAPGDLVQRFFGACSVVWCLPASRTDADSEALGTMLRPATMRRVARDAGYASCDVLDIEHMLFRFYRLTP